MLKFFRQSKASAALVDKSVEYFYLEIRLRSFDLVLQKL